MWSLDFTSRPRELLTAVCKLAGSASFLDDIDAEIRLHSLDVAISTEDSAPVIDWLLATFSYQGISDRVARDYATKHGSASRSYLQNSLNLGCSCPKLRSYWQFSDCRYDKTSGTCSEPEHIEACPLPGLRLRNGRLNQTAYSLFLFERDLADGNLVKWIARRLQDPAIVNGPDGPKARQEGLLGPLRNVYGVADKVLSMALSTLLIGVRHQRPSWFETGKAMVTIDSLAHNFLHRTGILQDCGRPHQYGTACYADGGCASIIRDVANEIDARKFNPSFPSVFPRFVQHAIWRFCAAEVVNCCNGNQIDDRLSCQNQFCRLGAKCSRIPLKSS